MSSAIEIQQKMTSPPEIVMRVVADGWLYASWSVGAVHVAHVDPGWPAPGSRIQHAVGLWPLLVEQSTEVVEFEPNQRVLLHSGCWPLGDVELTVRPEGSGSFVTLRYYPSRRRLARVLQRLISRARGRESLARLAALSAGQLKSGSAATI